MFTYQQTKNVANTEKLHYFDTFLINFRKLNWIFVHEFSPAPKQVYYRTGNLQVFTGVPRKSTIQLIIDRKRK